MRKIDWINYLLLFIITSLFVFDLFINKGEPVTMDGRIHITSITQFANALQEGQFPVVWLNNFANYGLPVGIFSHQIPLYLGALVALVVKDPVLSANIITFVGLLLTNWLFYYFLRLYVSPFPAFVASILFSVAPYRILNVYIRGAIPETFAGLFFPLILICLYQLFHKKKFVWFFFLLLSLAGLALTHPMMLLIFSIFIIPYGFYLLVKDKPHTKTFVVRSLVFISAFVTGLGLASYYIFPLFLEKKYFYFGSYTNMLTDNFLGLQGFFGTKWYYFYQDNIATRGHVLQAGLPEMIIFFIGIVCSVWAFKKWKNDEQVQMLLLSILIGGVTLFLMTPFAKGIYPIITPLENIQFPWRMLSLFIFIPPIILALLLEKKRFQWIIVLLVLLVVGFRLPQLYGKNYTQHSYDYYGRTLENLHSVNMNTIWTGKTEDYPDRTKPAAIVNGKGVIKIDKQVNTDREYTISAQTPVQIVDYTFYFPGWRVFVDKQEVPIEFQDPQYRGVITYAVPAGQHAVSVRFTDTQIRRIAKLLSAAFIVFVFCLFLFRKKIGERIQGYV